MRDLSHIVLAILLVSCCISCILEMGDSEYSDCAHSYLDQEPLTTLEAQLGNEAFHFFIDNEESMIIYGTSAYSDTANLVGIKYLKEDKDIILYNGEDPVQDLWVDWESKVIYFTTGNYSKMQLFLANYLTSEIEKLLTGENMQLVKSENVFAFSINQEIYLLDLNSRQVKYITEGVIVQYNPITEEMFIRRDSGYFLLNIPIMKTIEIATEDDFYGYGYEYVNRKDGIYTLFKSSNGGVTSNKLDENITLNNNSGSIFWVSESGNLAITNIFTGPLCHTSNNIVTGVYELVYKIYYFPSNVTKEVFVGYTRFNTIYDLHKLQVNPNESRLYMLPQVGGKVTKVNID